jgi:hypothetical protein
VGTASAIVRYAGFTILADSSLLHATPASVGYGLRRRRPDPILDLGELPAVDLAVLSGLHGEAEQAVERRLPPGLPVVTTLHAAAVLRAKGFGAAHGLSRGETVGIRKGSAHLKVTAAPGRHGPGLLSALLPPVMGARLEFRPEGCSPALCLAIAGDTAAHEHLRSTDPCPQDVDLRLLHLAGTRAFGLLLTGTGRQSEPVRLLNPRTAIAVHADDPPAFRSSLAKLVREVRAGSLQGRLRYLVRGETYRFEVPAGRLALTRAQAAQ